MRLVLVVQRYGADIAGGSEQCCRMFAERLAVRGHQVEVVTSCARRYTDWANELPEGESTEAGVLVRRFPVDRPRDLASFNELHRVATTTGRPLPLFQQVDWAAEMGPRAIGIPDHLRARAREVDAIVFFTYLYWPTVVGLPAVAGTVPTLFHPTAHDEPSITVPLYDRIFRLPDAFGFLTVEERDLLARRFGVQKPNRIVGVGVELDVTGDGTAFRQRTGIGDDPYLVYVGRVDPGKGSLEAHDYFVAYKDRNPGPLKLVIVGDQVHPLPDHPDVVLTGFLSDQEKDDALAGCTAFLQPSYFESFSMALTEAWALRRPALVQGRCEVLVGQARRSGGALPYDGFAEFEATVDLILSEPGLGEELGAAGRRYVEREYAWGAVMDRYDALLDDALGAFAARQSATWASRVTS